ncbi:diacylglycerol kinase [uncultured Fusobacterium sp.]|uniref:diacylglycerol kinase n=1 Tax=uncultured Fusobacterium sp. TaxID=159267 RepID=UPI00259AB850|nr:diacylglycerol kinase [uncultured Fusobacterium sp.]
MEKNWKKQGITESFNAAFEGLFEAIRSERHMKFHCFCTIIVLILSLFLELGKYETLSLIISITLMWIAELFNTAIESCVDMVTEEYHPLAKRAKDIAASAVLVTALNALLVGYIIFEKKITFQLRSAFYIFKRSYQHTALSIFVIIIIIVICLKLLFKKGTPLRGGIPSGHSALASSIFTIITFLTNNPKIFFLSLILVVLVMHSRIEGKIHTLFETVIGAFLGWGVTYLILLLLKM